MAAPAAPRLARALSTAPARKRRVVFSGIQPTGVPHVHPTPSSPDLGSLMRLALGLPDLTRTSCTQQVGNHLGALAQWQRIVKEAAAQPADSRDSLFFSVVGLHALTVPQVRPVLSPSQCMGRAKR